MNPFNRYSCRFVCLVTLCACGCESGGRNVNMGTPQPLPGAVAQLNENIARIDTTLRAVGHVDGNLRDAGGVKRHYNLDGTMFYRSPNYFRFNLKSFGDSKFTMGSNSAIYWYENKTDNSFHCGRQGDYRDLPREIPIRPDQVVDAFGLRPLSLSEPHEERLADGAQQIHFLAPASRAGGKPLVTREYWLDMRDPRIVKRVIFRDPSGAVTMDARLSNHRQLGPDGPLLPMSLAADWPRNQSNLRIRVQRWSFMPDVTPGSAQFEPPRPCVEH